MSDLEFVKPCACDGEQQLINWSKIACRNQNRNWMFLCCVSIGFRYHKLDDFEIIGMDYIWKIVLNSNPNIANKAVELLKDCYEKTKKFACGLQDSRNCKVCLVEEVSRVLSPCYHAICCNTCIKSIKICPICRAKIQDSQMIFF